MLDISRREFVRAGSCGLAGLGLGSLLLPRHALPTEESGDLGTYGDYMAEKPPGPAKKGEEEMAPTQDNIKGPFHRAGAPYRAKITPPLEPGTALLVVGQVYGHDTKKPLAGAVLDIWQANDAGRYDNDDPKKPVAEGIFLNRARLITDENGYYEFETVLPGRYKIGPRTWRPRHIHYWAQAAGYKELVTQLYFEGDPYNESDAFIKKSLIIGLEDRKNGESGYKAGTFNIVLGKA